jgi:hypothetical protein
MAGVDATIAPARQAPKIGERLNMINLLRLEEISDRVASANLPESKRVIELTVAGVLVALAPPGPPPPTSSHRQAARLAGAGGRRVARGC